jgi:hypothetical protein
MTNDPVLIAYSARRRKNGRAHWQRIGQAWPHEKGAGLTVVLDLMPLDGRIILLERFADDDDRIFAEAQIPPAQPKR